MGVFVVLILVPVLIQHTVIRGKNVNLKKKKENALFFFFLLLGVLVALRHESVGSDTRNYIFYFEQFSKMSWKEIGRQPLELGFSYFNKIVSIFTKEPQIFLAICAVIVIVMIYPTYKRLCIDPSLTIVLFCIMSTFVMMFSGIRQMIAIGIGFIAYEFTRQKRPVAFVWSVIAAVTFHTSAFMLVIMYPVYHAKITKKWLFVFVPALIVLFIFNKPIFSVLAFFLERYTKYDASVMQTGAFTMIILFVILVVFAFLIPEEGLLNEETIGLRNFLLLALALQMFAPLNMIAMRMNYYYIIFIPLLLPKIIASRNRRWRQVAIAGRHVMVIFFLLYFLISARNGGKLHVFPYHFFWENI